MTTHVDALSVLRAAEMTLAFARQGAADYFARSDRSHAGLHNAITQGRSVTFVLQNMKNLHPDFSAWYATVEANLRADPNAKWFIELRNRIEKQGQIGNVERAFKFNNLSASAMNAMNRSTPDGAISMFIGDALGRSGWCVAMPDGSETRVYFSLSSEIVNVELSMEDGPEGFTLEKELPRWLDSLEAIVLDAKERFSGASS